MVDLSYKWVWGRVKQYNTTTRDSILLLLCKWIFTVKNISILYRQKCVFIYFLTYLQSPLFCLLFFSPSIFLSTSTLTSFPTLTTLPYLAWPRGSSDNAKTPFPCFIRATWALSTAAQTEEEEMLISACLLIRRIIVQHKLYNLVNHHISFEFKIEGYNLHFSPHY